MRDSILAEAEDFSQDLATLLSQSEAKRSTTHSVIINSKDNDRDDDDDDTALSKYFCTRGSFITR